MGTAAVIAGGAILGAVVQDKSSKRAAKAATRGQDLSIEEQQASRDQARADAQPFVDIGLGAGEQLQNLLANPSAGLDEINPVVDILRKQGFEQIQESAAGRGRLGAGGTLKDLTQFNTDLTTTVIPQLQNQRFNQLFNVLGMGQNAAAGQGTATLQTGANISNARSNIGAIGANRATERGNMLTNLLNTGTQAFGQFGQSAPQSVQTANATQGFNFNNDTSFTNSLGSF